MFRICGMNDRVLGFATRVMVMAIVISVILLFLGTVILILFHVCITGRAFRRGLGNDAMVDRGSLGSSSMSRDDVEKLPCFDYKAKDKGSSPVDCAVCLENFIAGEKCRLLPLCRHSFHAQCVDSWLLRTPICPICRANADSWDGGSVAGEASSRLRGFVIELRESQTTENGQLNDVDTQVRESQIGESSHLGGIVIELGDSQTTESGHMSELGDELGDIERVESAHLGGIVIELGDSQTGESGQLSDINDEQRDNHLVESSHLSAAEIESREIQTGIVGSTERV